MRESFSPFPKTKPVTKILLDEGDVEPINLVKALARQQTHGITVSDILVSNGWVTPEALLRAQMQHWQAPAVDPASNPPDPELVDMLGHAYCRQHRLLPLHRIDDDTLIVTCRPEVYCEQEQHLAGTFGPTRMAICTETQFERVIQSINSLERIRQAENSVPAVNSCRAHNHRRLTMATLVAAAILASGIWVAPSALQIILLLVIFAGMLLHSGLRLSCLVSTMRMVRRGENGRHADETAFCLPVISVIVPLYKEADIIGDLVQRLCRLRYPRELTDILLAVESDDALTKAVLSRADLPPWIRVIEVPDGPIRTKPRALNYALEFCRGEIIGAWDAEDQPEPDQLRCIASHFHDAPKEVACVQGVLDYYNPRTNALARFFTIEYAAWFRVILPAIARLGCIVPLGGTTCFFRREVLEQLGAWDAWNVTEDADLGVRLMRHGWRTEIAHTVTYEEANCRLVPWIRQRSRWFKGYAMTWGVHMRDPIRLWRDLGPKRFLTFQVQFFFMLSQHLLAPAVWGFWLLSFSLSFSLHDTLVASLSSHAPTAFFSVLLGTEVLGIIVNAYAVRGHDHRHLIAWAPFIFVYFPLASLAAWKSAVEVVVRPFYWDKTTHGVYAATIPTIEEASSTISVPFKGRIGEVLRKTAHETKSTTIRGRTMRSFWRKAG